MTHSFLLQGFLIGLSIAAPVGPIGLLCINRSLSGGFASGFVSGLGAASADGIYGIMAASGLMTLSGLFLSGKTVFSILGGTFLCYLGIRNFIKVPFSGNPGDTPRGNLIKDYLSTLGLTLTNPMTILSFSAIFAGLGLGTASEELLSALLMVMGVFSGSAAWWLSLAAATSCLRKRISPNFMTLVNRMAGAILIIFGLIALFRPFIR